ncbi:MAG: redox-regulated ATPase YchF [Puniceicoccales bacterium]|nr:redox-regulated ATPase YchF [Puniceicoccales bacterium]
MKVGIVGLPNAGKSTLFNALTRSRQAQVGDYPFCTIEPNVGVVPVPDGRLAFLAGLAHSEAIIPAVVEFVDIAGLVAGASRGEGLGNRFLARVREMDALVHVVRCFAGNGGAEAGSALGDVETVATELLLADLESLEGQLERQRRRAKGGEKDAAKICALAERLVKHLGNGQEALSLPLGEGEGDYLGSMCLLTAKPVLYVCNVAEADLAGESGPVLALRRYAEGHGPAAVCAVSARLEEELGDLDPSDAAQLLAELGVADSGVDRLIRMAYELLRLASFFTAGEKETRAWTFRRGMRAAACAGVIHGDFEKGFIRAEVVSFADLFRFGSMAEARAAGRYRMEGKDYRFQDGDVALFRFSGPGRGG